MGNIGCIPLELGGLQRSQRNILPCLNLDGQDRWHAAVSGGMVPLYFCLTS